jgi:hypothetical protein
VRAAAARRGLSLGTFAVLALALALTGWAGASFKSQRKFAVGDFPVSVAVGDLNRDGRANAVTANADGRSVSVLLGKRKGVFKRARHINLGDFWPLAVAIGRLGRDRLPDIAVTRVATDLSSPSDLLVLKTRRRRGAGKGIRFQEVGPFPLGGPGSDPIDVEVVDLNRDGRRDVVTADRAFDRVGVLLGRANGTLRPLKPFPVGDAPQALAVGRIDDGKLPDVATANLVGDSVSVLRGKGGPDLLHPQQSFVATDGPTDIALGDVGADDRTDIVVTSDFGHHIARILNTGAGLAPPVFTPIPNEVSQVAIGRVNRDRHPDIVAVERSLPPRVRVVTISGGGKATLKAKGLPLETDSGNVDLVLHDLSRPRDRKPDIITADGSLSTLSVLLHR